MSIAPKDPLLLAGKVISILMQAAMAIGATVLLIMIPIMLFWQDSITSELREELADASFTFPTLPIIGIFLIGFAMVAMLFVFFGKLRRIISTVGEGDPFVPDNADRLTLMAWLMLGVQLLVIPATGLGLYLAKFADSADHADMNIDAGLDLSGILMVILLFILARVFRHGTAMRDDLEGTV